MIGNQPYYPRPRAPVHMRLGSYQAHLNTATSSIRDAVLTPAYVWYGGRGRPQQHLLSVVPVVSTTPLRLLVTRGAPAHSCSLFCKGNIPGPTGR